MRSLGTEDRRPDAPVLPREEIYQYIIFRSSDIKDLIVREPPRLEALLRRPESQLQDPAILEVGLEPPYITTVQEGGGTTGWTTGSCFTAYADVETKLEIKLCGTLSHMCGSRQALEPY